VGNISEELPGVWLLEIHIRPPLEAGGMWNAKAWGLYQNQRIRRWGTGPTASEAVSAAVASFQEYCRTLKQGSR